MQTDSIIYKTERLLLVQTTSQDAHFILELLNTPKYLRFIGDRHVYSLSGAKAYYCPKNYATI